MLSLIKTAWVRIKIAFDVKDPLQKTDKSFELPEDFHQLDLPMKQRASICNFIVNLGQLPSGEFPQLWLTPPKKLTVHKHNQEKWLCSDPLSVTPNP